MSMMDMMLAMMAKRTNLFKHVAALFLTKSLGAVAFWRVVKSVLFQATVWTESDMNMLSAVENG